MDQTAENLKVLSFDGISNHLLHFEMGQLGQRGLGQTGLMRQDMVETGLLLQAQDHPGGAECLQRKK